MTATLDADPNNPRIIVRPKPKQKRYVFELATESDLQAAKQLYRRDIYSGTMAAWYGPATQDYVPHYTCREEEI